jgi:cellulose biosynthesis protein BcsQ
VLVAATGLANKPMFNLASACDLNKFTLVGGNTALGGLSGYGVNAGENCITYNTTANIYSEITDLFIDTFKIGIADLKGVDIFLFNYVISNCEVGVSVNYATTSIPDTTTDIEIGNFINCGVGIDLVKEVTVDKKYTWSKIAGKKKFRVVVIDCGVKYNILRKLVNHNCEVIVLPAQTAADEILKMKPDGLFLSNGPGDPAALPYLVRTTKNLLENQEDWKTKSQNAYRYAKENHDIENDVEKLKKVINQKLEYIKKLQRN